MRKITSILFIVLANLILAACVPQPTATTTIIPHTPIKTLTSSPTTTSTHNPTATITSTRTKVPTYTPKPLVEFKTPTTEIDATIAHLPTPELPDECGTVQLGLPGTQSSENSDQIILSGTAILCAAVYSETYSVLKYPFPLFEGQLDLDSGVIGFSRNADIEYTESGGSMVFHDLFVVNDAAGMRWSYNFEKPPEPSFEACRDLVDTYNINNGPFYLCVTTTDGNISRVKIEEFGVLKDYRFSIKISFITWVP